MNSIENHAVGRGKELDPNRCQYVFPEGHAKAGFQCQGARYSTGYCAPHSKSQGVTARPTGAPQQPVSLSETETTAAEAQEMAQASLSRSAAVWLAKPQTQRLLQQRWDDILRNGTDAELIRLIKELTDRVEGRPTERQVAEGVAVPPTIAAIRAMSRDERRALLARHRPA